MWKNTVETDSPQMKIWRMRVACWIPKATNTHSEYVILVAFPLQRWFTNAAQCYLIRPLPVSFTNNQITQPAEIRSSIFSLPFPVSEQKGVYVQCYSVYVLSYGCAIWSVTWREEHRLRILKNRVLRKICGANGKGVTGEWRKLHNAELHEFYCSQSIIWPLNQGG